MIKDVFAAIGIICTVGGVVIFVCCLVINKGVSHTTKREKELRKFYEGDN